MDSMNSNSLLSALAIFTTLAWASAAEATSAQQAAAATLTAKENPACAHSVLGDYYWEVGDVNGRIASGVSGTAFTATTAINIDSASKWIYASEVVQYYGGSVPADQVPLLNFTSGFSNFGANRCLTSDTVASCIARNHVTQDPTTIGKFYYGGAHMQVHANNHMSMGTATRATLNSAVLAPMFGISSNLTSLAYGSPLIAGGVYTTAANYGAFLRRILSGVLLMKHDLGTHKVCTNPRTCPTAKSSPMQQIAENWNYSLGHWVEDDPIVGDHAFSSAGAGGFYPWIDQTKTYYGVLSRNAQTAANDGYVSAQCGRLIRQAFVTGVAVTSTNMPTPSH
jgi:hypothetical protein